MKKSTYTLIIITYTAFNIGILTGYNNYLEKSNEVKIVVQEKESEEADNKTEIPESQENNSEKIEDTKEKEENNNKGTVKAYMDEEDRKIYEKGNSTNSTNNNEVSYLESNKVFKIDAYEIEDSMSIGERLKVMNLLKDLTYDDFEEIEGYMDYKDEKLAVIKALKLLEKRLDKNEIESIKEIFSKYIDLEKVEGKY